MPLKQILTRILFGLGIMVRTWRKQTVLHYDNCMLATRPPRVYGYRLRRLSEFWPAKKPVRRAKAKAADPILPFDGTAGEGEPK